MARQFMKRLESPTEYIGLGLTDDPKGGHASLLPSSADTEVKISAASVPAAMVYALVPVFNRLHLTKECLANLLLQTYAPLTIIVIDGGSTDGTPEYLRRHYPRVVVLQDKRELWWGDAMQMGIEHCLQASTNEHDMLLMMNNDTVIGPGYVSTLVRVSQERRAAVGGMIVDSRDSTRILDAGEYVDWDSYSFPVKRMREPGEQYVEGVDLLSGRGTLVPLFMVRCAGNVNGERYPHYISDCEFFARLKRSGFSLGVSCEAVIRSHVEVTGLSTQHSGPLTFAQAWQALVSKRSVDNFRNHWRFIDDCAPAHKRRQLKRHLIRRCAYLIVSRTALRHVTMPLLWFVSGTYYVTKADCVACGCDVEALLRKGLIKSWRQADWYVVDDRVAGVAGKNREFKKLCRRAWNPLTKITRWMRARNCKTTL